MAQTVAVDFQHDGHRDVQEEENAGIDVHGPVLLCVESEVERRAVSRLYYILQAKQSGAKQRKQTHWPNSLSRQVSSFSGHMYNTSGQLFQACKTNSYLHERGNTGISKKCLSNNKFQSSNKIWLVQPMPMVGLFI